MRHDSPYSIASGAAEWIPLCDIYHHVLAHSPSPEAAKIALSDTRKNDKLHLHADHREYVARGDLKLQPGEAPPPLAPKITFDQPILSSDKFRTWDWEFCRATQTDSKTKSLFEYANIVGNRDDVLRLWPPVEVAISSGKERSQENDLGTDIRPTGLSKLEWAMVQTLDRIEEERSDQYLVRTQDELLAEVKKRLALTQRGSKRTLQNAVRFRRERGNIKRT
jgi:hypothetical protein